jgi:predicted nucleic acid-binding protein
MGSMKTLDTNVLIYLASGSLAQPLVITGFFISVISEIEVLGHPNLLPGEEEKLRDLLQELTILPIDEDIKNEAIRLRRTTRIRLPDAIVAATAIVTGSELLTHDVGLLKVPGLAATAPPLK